MLALAEEIMRYAIISMIFFLSICMDLVIGYMAFEVICEIKKRSLQELWQAFKDFLRIF